MEKEGIGKGYGTCLDRQDTSTAEFLNWLCEWGDFIGDFIFINWEFVEEK